MLDYLTFEPAITGGSTKWRDVPIDKYAESGVYLEKDDERLIVCDHPRNRFVVVLEHQTYPAFTALDIGDYPMAVGDYQGEVSWHVGFSDASEESRSEIGDLEFGKRSLDLYVQSLGGECYWTTLAYGRNEELPDPRVYRRWSIFDAWAREYFFYKNH